MCDLGLNTDNFNPKVLYTFQKKFSCENTPKSHSHDYLSIVHILSGSCIYNINNTLFKVKKGDTIILNPGVMHKKEVISENEILEFHVAFENVCIKNFPKNSLIQKNDTPIISSNEYELEILKCCNDIISNQSKLEPGSELMLKVLSMKLIIIILKSTYKINQKKQYRNVKFDIYDKTAIVNGILEFISEHYMDEISLDIISQNMYLSPAYISKIFKEEVNESPINYLIKIRLAKATDLLKENEKTIKEIANAVGYSDAYYFSKLFKKYYGFSPKYIKGKKNI